MLPTSSLPPGHPVHSWPSSDLGTRGTRLFRSGPGPPPSSGRAPEVAKRDRSLFGSREIMILIIQFYKPRPRWGSAPWFSSLHFTSLYITLHYFTSLYITPLYKPRPRLGSAPWFSSLLAVLLSILPHCCPVHIR